MTPERQPATPERQPATPERQPATPERQPATPERQPVTPVLQPVTPVLQPVTPVLPPALPERVPAQPGEEPAPSEHEPVKPGEEPAPSEHEPVKPGEEPAAPGEEPAQSFEEPARPEPQLSPLTALHSRREKGKSRREKGKSRREKGKSRREKGKSRREKGFSRFAETLSQHRKHHAGPDGCPKKTQKTPGGEGCGVTVRHSIVAVKAFLTSDLRPLTSAAPLPTASSSGLRSYAPQRRPWRAPARPTASSSPAGFRHRELLSHVFWRSQVDATDAGRAGEGDSACNADRRAGVVVRKFRSRQVEIA